MTRRGDEGPMKGIFALRAYQPRACRVYPPAVPPPFWNEDASGLHRACGGPQHVRARDHRALLVSLSLWCTALRGAVSIASSRCAAQTSSTLVDTWSQYVTSPSCHLTKRVVPSCETTIASASCTKLHSR